MTRVLRYPFYEIEHGGDERWALERAQLCGASDLEVVSRPYEMEDGAEMIRVNLTLADGDTAEAFSERFNTY